MCGDMFGFFSGMNGPSAKVVDAPDAQRRRVCSIAHSENCS